MKQFIGLFKIILFHPNRKKRAIITLLYAAIALYANFFMLQVFCWPVDWAAWYCIVFVLTLLIYPFAGNSIARNLSAFVLGAGVLPCVYCIVFLASPAGILKAYIGYALLILLFGGGFLAYFPSYLLWQVVMYFRQGEMSGRLCMLTGLIASLIPLLLYLQSFRQEFSKFTRLCAESNAFRYEQLAKNEYTEQLLGIGIKYHTQLEFIYDGWRPPMHHPFLNIGLWLYSDTHYPCKELNRKKYYKLVFPEKSLQMSCPCSYMDDGLTYFNEKW